MHSQEAHNVGASGFIGIGFWDRFYINYIYIKDKGHEVIRLTSLEASTLWIFGFRAWNLESSFC